jgi:hypothetical protein
MFDLAFRRISGLRTGKLSLYRFVSWIVDVLSISLIVRKERVYFARQNGSDRSIRFKVIDSSAKVDPNTQANIINSRDIFHPETKFCGVSVSNQFKSRKEIDNTSVLVQLCVHYVAM